MRLFATILLASVIGASGATSVATNRPGRYIHQLPRTNSAAGTNLIIVEIQSLGTNSTHTIQVGDLVGYVAGDDLQAAKAAASAGDTILVRSGIYYGCSNLLKAGVDWVALGAVTLTLTNTTNDPGWGIFDDRYSGATTSKVHGFNLIWSSGNPGTNDQGVACCINTNVRGGIVITNPATYADIEIGRLDYLTTTGGREDAGGVHVIHGSVHLTFDVIESYTNSLLAGTDFFGGDVYAEPYGSSIYWEFGDLWARGNILRSEHYSFWGNEPFNGGTNSAWLDVALIGGADLFYVSGVTNPSHKVWVKAHEVRSGINLLGVGRVYFEDIGKITVPDNGISIDSGEVWVSGQKMSSTSGSFLEVSGTGIMHARFQHYEDATGNTGGLSPAIRVQDSGQLNVLGGVMHLTNGVGLGIVSGTPRMFVDGMYIVGYSTNSQVRVNTNGLTLRNCMFIGTNTHFSITSTVNATNSVRLLNNFARTPHTNKVTAVGGTLTVDSALSPP